MRVADNTRGAYRIFYLLVGVYLLLGLINLAYVPVPWLDETANLEPAIMWHRTGHLISKGWPNPGADKAFLSYPPAIHVLHYCNLAISPCTVFRIRLPFLLLHTGSILLLYFLLRKLGSATWLAATVSALFMFDKVVFEISKAARSETLEIFLLLLLLHLWFAGKRGFILGVLCGALVLTHLKEWPVAGLIALAALYHNAPKIKLAFLAGIVLLPLWYLQFIHWDIHGLYQQWFLQSTEHAAHGSVLQRILDFLFTRFWPVYKEQPWVIPLHMVLLFMSCAQLRHWKKTETLPAILFAVGSIAWMLVLGPHYRYWPPMYLLGLLSAAPYLSQKVLRWKPWMWGITVPVAAGLAFPFVTRHTLGLVQREARDPQAALAFIENFIPRGPKTLLIGAEIGQYYMADKPETEFSTLLYPDHFRFEDYQQVFLLTDKPVRWKALAIYNPGEPAWIRHYPNLGRAGTFQGMVLYRIQSREQWDSIARPFFPR
ncbi:MAG: hypothetical protein JNL57_07005 [Bacteroidetes bacterium]|nr:hypothetical protein [Bacteroidota bacterium]